MARPLRIEYPGALYHITSRGDRRESIYADRIDRLAFLRIIEETVIRYNWLCHAYCLMGNHYHLMIETPEANLSEGMRYLNGVYTQACNRRHRRCGHLFQGRYNAIFVQKESYLLELCRYITLNPVRAGWVDHPQQWAWSSYRAMVGLEETPQWLTTDAVLELFNAPRRQSMERFKRFVLAGINGKSPWENIRQQVYLGGDDFIVSMQKQLSIEGDKLSVPNRQRRAPPATLELISQQYPQRNDAVLAAYATGAYSYRDIAAFHHVHLSTVGRIVRRNLMQQCEN